MQAYQLIEHGRPLEERHIEKPVPTGFEVLAKTVVTGICHTDVHVAAGDLGALKLPRTLGHEGVGIVEAVGPDVQNMKIGDRIGVAWLNRSCMECDLCKEGRRNLCVKQSQTGFIVNGSFAEYFIADERFAVRIPDSVSDCEAAPILCAGVTSFRALRQAEVKSGDRIVISGACGGVGHLAVQYAKVLGCEVVALDVFDEAKKELMKSLGADFVVDAKGDDARPLVEKFMDLQPQRPIKASIIFAPALSAVSDAVEYVSPGGTIVGVALPAGSFHIDVAKFILKELRLQGSIVGTPEDLEEAFTYAANGKVKAHVLEKPFCCVNEVLSDLKEGKIKGRVVVRLPQPN